MITIPTLKELYDDILADLESKVSITIPIIGPAFLRGLAGVQAAKLKLYYLAIAVLQKNIFVDTADPESKGGTLERFGRVKLGRNPFGAIPGQYSVIVTGEIGAVIPESQTYKSNDDSANPGALFVLDSEFTFTSTSETILLRALSAGTGSKLNINDKLTATAPIALVDPSATVSVEVVTPEAAEDTEDYRRKTINSYQIEPQGGAGADYRLWSQDAQGVEETYPYARSGFVNEMIVYVEATIADSTDGKGTPGPTILADVQEVIERDPDTTLPLLDRGRRPNTVIVTPAPITPRDVDIIITGYVGLNPTIESLILSSITDFVNSVRPFVSSIDIEDQQNDIIDVNKIGAAIIRARPGSIFTEAIIKIDGVQVSSFTFELGNIPFLNSVTYL